MLNKITGLCNRRDRCGRECKRFFLCPEDEVGDVRREREHSLHCCLYLKLSSHSRLLSVPRPSRRCGVWFGLVGDLSPAADSDLQVNGAGTTNNLEFPKRERENAMWRLSQDLPLNSFVIALEINVFFGTAHYFVAGINVFLECFFRRHMTIFVRLLGL